MTASEGWLSIEGIAFRCVIGVTERERQAPQEILVNLQVRLDFAKAAASDSIHDTVDYRGLARSVIEAGQRSSFQLLESLTSHLARVILRDFPGVEAVRLEAEKPHALSAARSVRAIVTSYRE